MTCHRLFQGNVNCYRTLSQHILFFLGEITIKKTQNSALFIDFALGIVDFETHHKWMILQSLFSHV